MASKPMNKHRIRLIAVGLVALLSLVTLSHLLATAGSHRAAGFGGEADEDGLTYVVTPQRTGPGDYITLQWEWFATAFQPVFILDAFYVVADMGSEFDPQSDRILFQATDIDPGYCCQSNRIYGDEFPQDADQISFVWVFDYRPSWEPSGAGDSDATILEESVPTSSSGSNAQQRELAYINAYALKAAQQDRQSVIETMDIQPASQRAAHPWFIAAEGLIGLAAIALWAASLARPEAPDAEGAMGIVQKGVRNLRAQLRLHVMLGPLLVIVGLFGLEAMDNGAFGIRDPAGIAGSWTIAVMVALWSLAVAVWIIGLIRTIKALRHYNKTQEPDLGGVGA